jgi:transcriptional regulator with XRE-family HTH domain
MRFRSISGMSIFSQRLSTARKFRRLSQGELARKTRLKQSAISQFETGRRAPSFHNLRRLADALEVSADYLLGRSNSVEMNGSRAASKEFAQFTRQYAL